MHHILYKETCLCRSSYRRLALATSYAAFASLWRTSLSRQSSTAASAFWAAAFTHSSHLLMSFDILPTQVSSSDRSASQTDCWFSFWSSSSLSRDASLGSTCRRSSQVVSTPTVLAWVREYHQIDLSPYGTSRSAHGKRSHFHWTYLFQQAMMHNQLTSLHAHKIELHIQWNKSKWNEEQYIKSIKESETLVKA